MFIKLRLVGRSLRLNISFWKNPAFFKPRWSKYVAYYLDPRECHLCQFTNYMATLVKFWKQNFKQDADNLSFWLINLNKKVCTINHKANPYLTIELAFVINRPTARWSVFRYVESTNKSSCAYKKKWEVHLSWEHRNLHGIGKSVGTRNRWESF